MYSTLCPFFSRHHSQVVRQRPAKPLCPSSNLGGASNKAASLCETCRFFFAISSVCFHFPGTPAPGFFAFIWKVGKCCAKRWTVALSSLPGGKLQTKRKDTKEKTSVSFGAEGETRQGAALSVRCANDPIVCPFLLRKKMDGSVLVSLGWGKLQQKEKVPRKILDTFWRRRRDSNSRAGCPTYALSRGASSPT